MAAAVRPKQVSPGGMGPWGAGRKGRCVKCRYSTVSHTIARMAAEQKARVKKSWVAWNILLN